MPLALRLALARCARSPLFWFWLVESGLVASVLQLDVPGGRLVWPVLCFFAGQLTTGLFVDRLASFRTRLVPGYREVYLQAMGLTGFGLVGLLTAWFSFWSAAPLWPAYGWAALAFALGCSTTTLGLLASCLSLMLIVAGITGVIIAWSQMDADRVWQIVAYAETGWLNVLLLVVAGLLLARLVERLWNLTEDAPTFDVILRRARLCLAGVVPGRCERIRLRRSSRRFCSIHRSLRCAGAIDRWNAHCGAAGIVFPGRCGGGIWGAIPGDSRRS